MHFRLALAAPLAALVLSAPTSTDSVHLAWKLKEGDVLRYRITQVMEQSITGPTEMEISNTSSIVMSQKVLAVSSDGVAEVDVKYDAMKMHMEMPMGAMDFDSTRTGDDAKKNDEKLAHIGRLVGSSFHMQLEPSGRVAELSGIPELLAKAFPDDAAADPMMGDMREMLKQSFGNDAIKKLIEVAVYPDKALSTGDHWNRTTSWELPMVGTLDIAMEFTLEGSEPQKGQECARIAVTDTISQNKAKGPGANMFADKFDVDVSVSDSKGKGTLHFAPESGRMVKQVLSQNMEMNMSMRAKDSDKSTPAMEMGISIDMQTTTELLGKDEPVF
jgi:hypothetical protein